MRRRLLWIVAGIVVVAAVLYGLYGQKGREMLERNEYPLRYLAIVRGHAKQYDIDPALLAAVIYSESRFRPHVRSPQGAIGLMQLLRARPRASRRAPGAPPSWPPPRRPRDQHPLRLVVPAPSAPALQGAAELDGARTGGLQRGHGERRLVGRADAARRAAADPAAFAETRHYLKGVEQARKVYERLYPAELASPRRALSRPRAVGARRWFGRASLPEWRARRRPASARACRW